MQLATISQSEKEILEAKLIKIKSNVDSTYSFLNLPNEIKNENFKKVIEETLKINSEFNIENFCEEIKEKYINEYEIITIEKEMNEDYINEKEELFLKDQITTFLTQIPKKILSLEEEKKYLNLVKQGNEKAKEYLIKHNLGLVASIAKKYQNRGLELADLIQEGCIGLMQAIEKFDLSKETKLSTYATFCIFRSISRAVADNGRTIRIPVYYHEEINNLQKTQTLLNNELGRMATTKELAQKLGMSTKKVQEIMTISNTVTSYNISLNPDDPKNEDELIDLIPDKKVDIENSFIQKDLKEQLFSFLKTLSDKEQSILINFFGLNGTNKKTLSEIAKSLSVSVNRVYLIKNKALGKLSKNEEMLKYFNSSTKKEKNNGKAFACISNYFSCDKIYLTEALNYLEPDEISFLEKIYDECYNKKEISFQNEQKRITKKLHLIIEALMTPDDVNRSYISLDKLVKINDKEELNCLIKKLNPFDQKLIYQKYEEDFNISLTKNLAFPLENYFNKVIVTELKNLKETAIDKQKILTK